MSGVRTASVARRLASAGLMGLIACTASAGQADPQPPAHQHAMPKPAPASSSAEHGIHQDTQARPPQVDTPTKVSPSHAYPSTGMHEMNMRSMQGGSPPPDARDPDAYSDGLRKGPLPGLHMPDDARFAYLLIDQLEVFDGDDASGQALDAQAWYGGDSDKLWLKADGERAHGRLGATRTEALWNHAIGVYWGSQLGVRHDFGDGPGRSWAALGVQGISPYWFDIEATLYAGQSGRTAARFEAEYDVLFTQRLILTPDFEINLYGRDDQARGIGSGLSDAELGLRLRYEFRRQFAPYVGIVWNRVFGSTADFARHDGKPLLDRQLVAGVHIWF